MDVGTVADPAVVELVIFLPLASDAIVTTIIMMCCVTGEIAKCGTTCVIVNDDGTKIVNGLPCAPENDALAGSARN